MTTTATLTETQQPIHAQNTNTHLTTRRELYDNHTAPYRSSPQREPLSETKAPET